MLLEQHGFAFSKQAVANNHLRNIPYHWLFSCTRQSYYHMVNLRADRPVDEQIAEFPTKINPWREGINTAIRADFWGYIAPGDPRRAARIALPRGDAQRGEERRLQLDVRGRARSAQP